jgi:flagellar motor component MotA
MAKAVLTKKGSHLNQDELIELFTEMAKIGREKGLGALKAYSEKTHNEFIKLGIKLLSSGVEKELMGKILTEHKIAIMKKMEAKMNLVIQALAEINKGTKPELVELLCKAYT